MQLPPHGILKFEGATISTKRRTTIFGISWLPTEVFSGDEASELAPWLLMENERKQMETKGLSCMGKFLRNSL